MMTNSTLALANKIDDEPAVPPAAVAADTPSEAAEGWQSVRSVQKPTSPLTILARAAEQVDWSGAMQSWTVRLLSLAAGILMWHLACVYNLDFFIRFNNVPAPLVVLSAFIGHVQDSKFYIHILVSMQRILISFGLATGC
jgi:hypothetical protein